VGTPSELTGPDHAGKTISRPPDRQTGATFKKAPKARLSGNPVCWIDGLSK
jgi:hypothetical protein